MSYLSMVGMYIILFTMNNIDLIIHKSVCKNCGELWNHTPILKCKKCGKDFSKSLKKDIIEKKFVKFVVLKCIKILQNVDPADH
ncbi:MAG: hypothetical protein FJW56_06855 [Actinobacteria bacterium]|nr:hypothetical protein [Actinomycetota bacterium]